MNEKNDMIEERINEDLDIFGRSKSREEIREEMKAEKKAKREAAAAARKSQREAKRSEPKEPHPEMRVMAVILAVVVLGCAVAMFFNFRQDNKNAKFEMDDTRETYFLDSTATPELSKDGLTAAVNMAYYTRGGYLCIRMTIGNGLDKDQHLVDIEVELSNGQTENLIAKGYTANVSPDYVVPAGGTNQYTFYISPEHVAYAEDPLTNISYSITLSGSDVTATTQTQS